MRYRLFLLFNFVLTAALGTAQRVQDYEYWLDSDYAARVAVSDTCTQLALTADLAGLAQGPHCFHFRARGSDGQWGEFSTYYFYYASATDLSGYEYWFDNDYAARVRSEQGTVPATLSLDLASLTPGPHSFNFRARDGHGGWGELSTYYFLYAPLSGISGYEYWLDNDYASRVTAQQDTVPAMLSMDISTLSPGVHHFNFRTRNTAGRWGELLRYVFYVKHDVLKEVASVVYWVDSLFDDRRAMVVSNTSLAFAADLSGLPLGEHVLQVRGLNLSGDTCMVDSFAFVTEDTPFTLTLKASGGGTATCKDVTVRDTVQQFTVLKGGCPATLLQPDKGWRIGQVLLDDTLDVTAQVAGGRYTLYDLQADATLSVSFVQRIHTLTAIASGHGQLTVNGSTLRDTTLTLRIPETTQVQISAEPDAGYETDVLRLNGTNITTTGDGSYTFTMTGDATLRATFKEKIDSFAVDGIRYAVISYADTTVRVLRGNYGGAITIPATVQHELPWHVVRADDNAFSGLGRLAAIVWQPAKPLAIAPPANPNLLVYVSDEAFAPANVENVVVAGVAKRITLTDGTGATAGDFLVPQPFLAEAISYTHEYTMETQPGVSRGWETLALPFDVATVTHESRGTLSPMGSGGDGKPFWLARLAATGLEPATAIEANRPYLISMPNCPTLYAAENNLAGRVTFAAENAQVPVTQPLTAVCGEVQLVPTFVCVERSDTVYAINLGEQRGQHPEGSVFERDYRVVRPFEAYTTHGAAAAAPAFIAIGDLAGGDTGIEGLQAPPDEVKVYSLSGVLLHQGRRDDVLPRLPSGVYVVGGRKQTIR